MRIEVEPVHKQMKREAEMKTFVEYEEKYEELTFATKKLSRVKNEEEGDV